MFCSLKDWRRIATRYYRFAATYLAAVCIAAKVSYWLRRDGLYAPSHREGTPDGAAKTIGGPGTIIDPGMNAKLRVDYTPYGFIPIQREYWVLDRATDYSWFISSDPTLRDLFIFTRNPAVRLALLRRLVSRARALGYDTSKLQFSGSASALNKHIISAGR